MKDSKRITAACLAAVILFSACSQTGIPGTDLSEMLSCPAQSSSEQPESKEASSADTPQSQGSSSSEKEPSSVENDLEKLSSVAQEGVSAASSAVSVASKAPVTSTPAATSKPPAVTSKPPTVSKTPSSSKKPDTETGVIIPAAGTYSGVISIRQPTASGTMVYTDGVSKIDASNTAQGYVMFYTDYSGGARLKLQIKASATYNYDVKPGAWYTFPLQMGNGSYEIKVMENTTGSKYRKIYGETISVALSSSLNPFLYPNQFVNYSVSSRAVKKSFDLCVNAAGEAQKVAAIYHYVTTHITYDSAKASSVTSGYLPNVDSVLASGKGICFDYAALTAAMLRAQGIPTRLAIGTKNGMSHAWNYIYLQNTGWIAVKISFSGGKWNFADTTFAAGGITPTESGYTTLRIY
ncbi:MAG: transglutaminase-like domain-containing protein [Acutalibacteraceae bacterium]|jgi:transglutaminase-like putative cysteine protease